MALTTVQKELSGPGTAEYTSQTHLGFKNRCLNRNFDIWQRGTTFPVTSATIVKCADRWISYGAGVVSAAVSQQTASNTFANYSIRVQRNNTSAAVPNINLTQVLETISAKRLAGGTFTFSAYLKAGANFSAASNLINLFVQVGTGTDEGSQSLSSGSWTGLTTVTNQTVALTTATTRYSITGTIPSNATELAFGFYFTPTGTAGAADYFEVEGVQFEAGSILTKLETVPIGYELALCQRYFEKSFPFTTTPAQNAGLSGSSEFPCTVAGAVASFGGGIPFKVAKRTSSPALVFYNPSAANAFMRNTTRSTDATVTGAGGNTGDSGFSVTQTGLAGWAVGDVLAIHWTADSEL